MSELARLHSQDAEQAVLGALLSDPDCAAQLGALKPDHCYSEAHRLILAEIMSMLSRGEKVDAVTVAESLSAVGYEEQTGGLAYLGELVANCLGSRNVRNYAEIIIGKAMERALLGATDTIRETVSGIGTTHEKLMAAQAAIMTITEGVAVKQPRPLREILADNVAILEQRGESKLVGTPTGFDDLDHCLSGGMRPGNVIVIAGRPSMGKTALAVNIGLFVANSLPVLMFSMEMSEQELVDRLIAQSGLVALDEVLAGHMDGESGERILSGVSMLQDLPFLIDEQGGLTLFDLASKARSVKRRYPDLGLIVIDYLQLMSGQGDTRNEQIGEISRGIKALAKELGLPIILLSQLNRSLENRPNKRPVMSDLRESGAIEQDADVILFVYRDEVYNPDTPDAGTAEIISRKNRQGKIGTVRLGYQGEFTRFVALAHDWKPAEKPKGYVSTKRRGLSDY